MAIEPRELPLAGDRERPMRWFAVLSLLPLALACGVLAFVAIKGAGTRAAPPLPLLLGIPLLIGAVQLWFVRRLRAAGAFVAEGDLILRTGVGTQRIPLARLRKHGLRRVNLVTDASLRPWLRTRGAGLPGFHSGWFRLRNGERAVCLLLDRSRVSYLRSDEDNLSVLLSLRDPAAFEAMLERGRG